MWQLDAEAKRDERRDRRGLHVIETGNIDAFLGMDVGKGEHDATAVPLPGRKPSTSGCPTPKPSSANCSVNRCAAAGGRSG
ncbi:hypothetical protein [Streptomyces sp. NPDC058305]|uniref:hypothetical protein n=1 Tax=Streptomyces sp. NPDC058305 TaxID=3346438 RepID=UPI0036E63D69